MAMKDPKMMATMRTPQEEVVVMDGEEDEVALPGFRFHPTDEELVSFYLKRKIEKKPLSFEIIKQVDIYKHDPWDLAKLGGMVGDKEWYFYCKRGRKYKNSARPNRVTGSGGFWKATGIDRPIYDSNVEGSIVGLKKSLVYYRGSAGKGTKTDWMMHEFRLPSQSPSSSGSGSSFSHLPMQAEIWTLCRIMKRSRRYTPDWRELSSKRVSFTSTKSTSNVDSAQSNNTKERYISFINPSTTIQIQPPQGQPFGDRLRRRQNEEQMIFETENTINYSTGNVNLNSSTYHDFKGHQASPLMDHQANNASEFASNFSSPLNATSSGYDQDQVDGGNFWEDLNSVVEFAMTQLYD